jgi:hypothetical protein
MFLTTMHIDLFYIRMARRRIYAPEWVVTYFPTIFPASG